MDTLRNRYQALQRENDQKQEQLASLQLMASEVSVALGLKRQLEGADDIADEEARWFRRYQRIDRRVQLPEIGQLFPVES